MKLTTQILIALVLGALAGYLLGERVMPIAFVGTVFLKLIKMIVIPLVVSSIIVGAGSLGDLGSVGRLGGKTFGLYLSTTLVAVLIGLTLANIIEPGAGFEMTTAKVPDLVKEGVPSLGETLLAMIPENPLGAIVEPNIVQAILFSLLFGIALNFVGEVGKPVARFMESVFAVMMRITDWVLKLAPLGVFALIAVTVGESGIAVFVPLAKYCLTVILGLAVQFLVVYPILAWIFVRSNPFRLYRKTSDALAMAFSTASSSATLPVTIECLEKKAGLHNRIVAFVIPLGATMNMDGTALYEAVAALFIAQVYGIDLSIGQQVTVVLLSTIAAIGAAGIPSAGLVTMALVLNAVGLPLEGIGLILSVDRVLDMARTMVNVAGDIVVASAVASSEHALDRGVLNAD